MVLPCLLAWLDPEILAKERAVAYILHGILALTRPLPARIHVNTQSIGQPANQPVMEAVMNSIMKFVSQSVSQLAILPPQLAG